MSAAKMSLRERPMFAYNDGQMQEEDEEDDEVHWTALEIRKRIEDRHEEARKRAEHDIVNAQSAMKRELHILHDRDSGHHGRTATMVTDGTDNFRRSFVQSDQQFKAIAGVRYLSEDSQRNTRRQREHVDKLDELTKRLIRMRGVVQQGVGSGTYADAMVDQSFRERFRGETSKIYKQCSKCGVKVMHHLLEKHESLCLGAPDPQDAEPEMSAAEASKLTPEQQEERKRKIEERLAKKKRDKERFMATQKKQNVVVMAPQAPRDLVVLQAGHNFIAFQWKVPILDGGAQIYEYEIAYDLNNKKKVGKKFVNDFVEQPPMRTSRWFLKKPVMEQGFTLRHLRGSTEYANVKVRARNEVDWGPFSKPLEAVETAMVQSPSVPLFFVPGRVTATTISLSWQIPIDDGGDEIVDFNLSYTEVIPREDLSIQGGGMMSKGAVDKFDTKDWSYRLGGFCEEYLMTDLRGDNEYYNFKLVAVNKSEYQSEPAEIKSIKTALPSWRQRLAKELQRVNAIKKSTIDTDFYMGYSQRLDKDDYVRRLTEDLRVAELEEEKEDPAEAEAIALDKKRRFDMLQKKRERLKADGILDDGDDEEAEAWYAENIPAYTTRKKQFESKITSTKQIIEDSEKTRVDAVGRRAELSANLADVQKRIVEVKAEASRVNAFTGTFLNSSVIHGSDQRFTVEQLKEDLQEELEKSMKLLASKKKDIVKNDENRRHMIKLKADKLEELKSVQAKYSKFMSDAKKARKINTKMQEKPDDQILLEHFDHWLSKYREFVRVRSLMLRVWGDLNARLTVAAFTKWKTGKHAEAKSEFDDYVINGRGAAFLCVTQTGRNVLSKDISAVITNLYDAKKDVNLMKYTAAQKRHLEASKHYEGTEHAHTIAESDRELDFLVEGEGFLEVSEFKQATDAFLHQIRELKRKQAELIEELKERNRGAPLKGTSEEEQILIHYLSMTYERLARAHFGNLFWDRGILSADRARSLATEISHAAALAQATLTMANGYMGKSDFSEAQRYFEISMLKFREVGDKYQEAIAHRGLETAFEEMNSEFHSKKHKVKAEEIEQELPNALKDAVQRLDKMKKRLVNTSASCEQVVTLERVSGNCIKMRRDRVLKLRAVEEFREEAEKQSKIVQREQNTYDAIIQQQEEALESTEDEMKSSLITGTDAVFDIEELKIRLKEKEQEQKHKLDTELTAMRAADTKIANAEDDMKAYDEDLAIENGALMRHVMGNRMLRNIAINGKSIEGNEVMGSATGGVELVAASEGRNLNVFDIHTGELLTVFVGDEPGRHVGENEGHVAQISCLCFYGDFIYSGGMDMVIHVWDIVNKKRIMCLQGHEATVVCVAVDDEKIMSGAADQKINIWDRVDGTLLRTLGGHKKSVTCLNIGPTWFVSGGADGEVRVWSIPAGTETFKGVKSRQRLRGHESGVTAVAYGFLEVVSGTQDGNIFVWWLETKTIIKKIKAHETMVRQLQFDATRIVSCGNDGTAVIVDITNGEVSQSLRGHEKGVVAVAFDTIKILTASSDNTLRLWKWGTASDAIQDKLHVWEPGDTIPKVAQKYDLSVRDLVRWNAIRSTAQIYPGIKLIVQKGDPSKPTKAEKEAADRKAAEVRRGQKSKTVRDVQVDEAKAFKLTGSLAEQQKIHILTMPEPKALQHYGYTGYSDKQTYSSRVVRSMGLDEEEIPLDERINPRKLTDAQLRTELEKRKKITTGTRVALYQRLEAALEEDRKARLIPRPHYQTMGPTMLDKDYVDVETRRAGKEWKSEHNIIARIKPFITKTVDDELNIEEEIDDVEREELLMAYKPDKEEQAKYILAMLIAGVAAEEAQNTADEQLRHSFDTWWPETLGARLTFAQDHHSQEVAKEEKKTSRTRLAHKMPKINKARGGFGKRQQDFAYEMRRSQASWKGFSTLDPGGEYGKIDPMFGRTSNLDHKELKKARKQEKKLRKVAGAPRLKALSTSKAKERAKQDALRRKEEREEKMREDREGAPAGEQDGGETKADADGRDDDVAPGGGAADGGTAVEASGKERDRQMYLKQKAKGGSNGGETKKEDDTPPDRPVSPLRSAAGVSMASATALLP